MVVTSNGSAAGGIFILFFSSQLYPDTVLQFSLLSFVPFPGDSVRSLLSPFALW